ncbi:MAG: helix-turn-helix transcriptional regulator [Planctomycetaceae bacterium]|nr:helix-turn-helix transcriptional regulator [Planctomycetaceae bacterium]
MNATYRDKAMPLPGSEVTTFVFRPAPRDDSRHQPNERRFAIATPVATTIPAGVEFRPAPVAARQTAAWRGISGEVDRVNAREAFECEYCGPSHLLIVYQHAVRERGDSTLDDLPRSTLHNLSGKLTLVPAGSWFRERQEPTGPVQVTYLYIDPRGLLMDAEPSFAAARLTPRLFFDNHVVRGTALKLAEQIEAGPLACRAYAEALGVVLLHELLQLDGGRRTELPAQGGLADWQRRIVVRYIEENLAEKISVTKLAELVRLSPYHFARAFKKTLGIPPRRYHMRRRIDRAKMLLASPSLSVTEIADQLGFADTSSFSVAFHNRVGRSPRAYRRSLS